MKQLVTLTFIICLLAFRQSFAQEEPRITGRLFFSVNSGIFIMANENFRKPYNDPTFSNVGASMGVPIGQYSHIIAKITYLQGEAFYTSVTYHKNPDTGKLDEVSESQGDRFRRTQTISQIGIQRQFPIASGWSIFANTGLSFTNYTETLTDGEEDASSGGGKGFIGGFIGAGFEKKTRNETFSVFAEGVYTHTNTLLSLFIGDQAGSSLAIGVRYYLPTPKNAQKYQKP